MAEEKRGRDARLLSEETQRDKSDEWVEETKTEEVHERIEETWKEESQFEEMKMEEVQELAE